ncbi:MAG: helix-turn-helix transcriptional regulator [Saprospiraceae bacterium]|nr:helix-turn-helix transcriptional regulator [Saprospiraceae bacterium]
MNNTPKIAQYGLPSTKVMRILLNPGRASNSTYNIVQKKVHFIFNAADKATLEFGPFYQRALQSGHYFIIYNPEKDLEFSLNQDKQVGLFWIELELSELHECISREENLGKIFEPDFAKKIYYKEYSIPTNVELILREIFEHDLPMHLATIYDTGKSLEIISLLLAADTNDFLSCPFLNDEEIMRKIKQAKDILVSHFAAPPVLADLAKEVGINEFQLKSGFKQIYGKPPYQFVLEYKMSHAKQLLESGKYLVHEVADQVGYTNISHFIEAFKKKYGVTPKKLSS